MAARRRFVFNPLTSRFDLVNNLTPWTSDIDAAGFDLNNVGTGTFQNIVVYGEITFGGILEGDITLLGTFTAEEFIGDGTNLTGNPHFHELTGDDVITYGDYLFDGLIEGDITILGTMTADHVAGDITNATGSPTLDNITVLNDATFYGDVLFDDDIPYTKKTRQLITVSPDGTQDFKVIQDAIDSVMDASINKQYMIQVYPGIYTEQLTCKDYVHITAIGGSPYGEGVVTIQHADWVIKTAGCLVSNCKILLLTGGFEGTPSQYTASGDISAVFNLVHGLTYRDHPYYYDGSSLYLWFDAGTTWIISTGLGDFDDDFYSSAIEGIYTGQGANTGKNPTVTFTGVLYKEVKIFDGQAVNDRFVASNCNIQFAVNGNFGAADAFLAQNNAFNDFYLMNCGIRCNFTTTGDIIIFDSLVGSCNAVNLYVNHFNPQSYNSLIFDNMTQDSSPDEWNGLWFRDVQDSASVTYFKNNAATRPIQIHAVYGLETLATATFAVDVGGGGLKIDWNEPVTGANDTVLVADNTVSLGRKWATVESLGYVPYTGATTSLNMGLSNYVTARGFIAQGNAATIYIYPYDGSLTGYGRILFKCLPNTGDHNIWIFNAAHTLSADRFYTIPDVAADASFVMTQGNQTINAQLTVNTLISNGIINATGLIANPTGGNSGLVRILPPTAAKGNLDIRAADSAGNTRTLIVNASQAAARIYTIPDAGYDATFVMSIGSPYLNRFGLNALSSVTSGSESGGYGHNALKVMTSGYSNYVVGDDGFAAITDAHTNVGMGHGVGFYLVHGSDNTLVGTSAGFNNEGSSNVFIGMAAGSNQTAATKMLLIDSITRASAANELTQSLLYGTFHATVTSQQLTINGNFNVAYYTQLFYPVTFGSNGGIAGQLSILGPGAASGGLAINGATNAGSFYAVVTNASHAATHTYTIPDAGADSSFVMSKIGGVASISGRQLWDAAGNIVFDWNTTYKPILYYTLQLGANGFTGEIDIFAPSSNKGHMVIQPADSAANYTLFISNRSQAASRNYYIPDAGADANFLMSTVNLTTKGTGSPLIVDVVTLSNQSADITTTNFTNAGTAGLYRVAWVLEDTTADITAGAVTLTVAWTDGVGATTATATQVLTGTGRATGNYFLIQLASGNITYAVSHTGLFGSAKYALYTTCERLS